MSRGPGVNQRVAFLKKYPQLVESWFVKYDGRALDTLIKLARSSLWKDANASDGVIFDGLKSAYLKLISDSFSL